MDKSRIKEEEGRGRGIYAKMVQSGDKQQEDVFESCPHAGGGGGYGGADGTADDVGDLREDKEEIETRCGLGQCRPSCLQRLNNPKVLCFCLCAYTLVQGFAVNGINNVNTTSYERRFELTSSSVGWISSCFDISAAICGVIIGFYGNQRNKGRILTVAFVLSSLGSTCMYLPHFFTDDYQWGQGSTHLCKAAKSADLLEDCTGTGDGLPKYLSLFLMGQLLHGLGGSTLITVGYSFIDDSVSSAVSPIYISLVGLFQMLGPMIGFVVGGALLNLYVDFDRVPSSEWGITPADPRWVGAWWVGFVISSLLMFMFALPFSLFGSELPQASHVRDTRISETHNDGHPTRELVRVGEKVSFREFPRMTLRLLRNPAFMCVAFAGSFLGFVTISLATFLPKYIQNVFGTSASTAATFAGLIIIPGAGLGQVFGGFVIRHWQLKVKTIIRFVIGMVALAVVAKTCFLIHCEKETLAGWNTEYINSTSHEGTLFSTCNVDCHCDSSVFNVVCDQQGQKYFSPCLAGCSEFSEDKGYTKCACVLPSNNVSSVSIDNCTVGTCNSTMYIFLFMILLSAFTVSGSTVPALTVVLRCAHENERTFALGLLNFIARIVGTIPGPIVYGAVIDSSCGIWGTNCGAKTSCWLYDNKKMGDYLALLSIGFTSIAVFFFIMAYKLYKPPVVPKKDNDNAEDNDSLNINEVEVAAHAQQPPKYGSLTNAAATQEIVDTHL